MELHASSRTTPTRWATAYPHPLGLLRVELLGVGPRVEHAHYGPIIVIFLPCNVRVKYFTLAEAEKQKFYPETKKKRREAAKKHSNRCESVKILPYWKSKKITLPYNTRNMSQPQIFRKPTRYTVSEGFSLEKVKHKGKSGKSKICASVLETVPGVSVASISGQSVLASQRI